MRKPDFGGIQIVSVYRAHRSTTSSSRCGGRTCSRATCCTSRRACCFMGRPAPARPCWPRRWPRSRAPSSSTSGPGANVYMRSRELRLPTAAEASTGTQQTARRRSHRSHRVLAWARGIGNSSDFPCIWLMQRGAVEVVWRLAQAGLRHLFAGGQAAGEPFVTATPIKFAALRLLTAGCRAVHAAQFLRRCQTVSDSGPLLPSAWRWSSVLRFWAGWPMA